MSLVASLEKWSLRSVITVPGGRFPTQSAWPDCLGLRGGPRGTEGIAPTLEPELFLLMAVAIDSQLLSLYQHGGVAIAHLVHSPVAETVHRHHIHKEHLRLVRTRFERENYHSLHSSHPHAVGTGLARKIDSLSDCRRLERPQGDLENLAVTGRAVHKA